MSTQPSSEGDLPEADRPLQEPAAAEPVSSDRAPASQKSPEPRKRTAKRPPPEGEAPEILDTMLGTTASGRPGSDAAAAHPAVHADAHLHTHVPSVSELADRLDDSRFFSSLFDFTFTSYVARKLAGPVYVVGLVLIGLGVVMGFGNSLSTAIATNSPAGAFVFLLGVLVTLVAAILAVLLLRVTIEVFCAIIEIAQNTRRRPRK